MSMEVEALFVFVRQEVPPPLNSGLSLGTDLRGDLRMAEEDADEFMARFAQAFHVAPGDFDLTRYFPSEGMWLFGRKRPAPVPLTLGRVLHAVLDGVWNTSAVEADPLSRIDPSQ
jgi:hypothetical protein